MATIMHVSAIPRWIAEVGGIHRARQKCDCGQQSTFSTSSRREFKEQQNRGNRTESL